MASSVVLGKHGRKAKNDHTNAVASLAPVARQPGTSSHREGVQPAETVMYFVTGPGVDWIQLVLWIVGAIVGWVWAFRGSHEVFRLNAVRGSVALYYAADRLWLLVWHPDRGDWSRYNAPFGIVLIVVAFIVAPAGTDRRRRDR